MSNFIFKSVEEKQIMKIDETRERTHYFKLKISKIDLPFEVSRYA